MSYKVYEYVVTSVEDKKEPKILADGKMMAKTDETAKVKICRLPAVNEINPDDMIISVRPFCSD